MFVFHSVKQGTQHQKLVLTWCLHGGKKYSGWRGVSFSTKPGPFVGCVLKSMEVHGIIAHLQIWKRHGLDSKSIHVNGRTLI